MAIGGNTALGPSHDSDQLVGRGPLARVGPPIVVASTTRLANQASPISAAGRDPYVTTKSGRQHQRAAEHGHPAHGQLPREHRRHLRRLRSPGHLDVGRRDDNDLRLRQAGPGEVETHSDTTPAITYNYDLAGNLTSRIDATGTTSFTYDQANRPLSRTTPAGTLSYTWDRAGNLTTATDPTGTTTYFYDKLNRLDQVDEPTGRKNVFAYDTLGRQSDSWYNTGANVAYLGDTVIAPSSFAVHTRATYDADSQLVGLRTTRASSDGDANRVSDLSYAFTVPAGTTCPNTASGTPTSIRHAVTDALAATTTAYCYDPAGRLISASTPGGASYAYGFDANTNRISGPEGAHSVNSGDQLTDPGFAYNADGGLTAGGSLSALAYNGIGQTAAITQAATTTAYTYAGGGQAERTTAAGTTALHGRQGLVLETTAGATTSYIRGPGGSLIAERTPVGDYYYVYDGQGSVVALVDPAGVQRAAYAYDPYGSNATATGVNGALPPNPWRWNGAYLDSTGLYKLGARYYDPGLGRFTQVDPVRGGSANDYDYANGDPINQFDLSGLGPCPPFLHRTRPDGSHYCKGNAAASPVKEVYRHTEVGISMCAIRCVGIGTQGGTVYRQTGYGCCFIGGNVGFAPREYRDRGCNAVEVTGRAGPVALYGEMGIYGNPKERLPPSADFAGGWGPGLGVGAAGMTNRDFLGERSC